MEGHVSYNSWKFVTNHHKSFIKVLSSKPVCWRKVCITASGRGNEWYTWRPRSCAVATSVWIYSHYFNTQLEPTLFIKVVGCANIVQSNVNWLISNRKFLEALTKHVSPTRDQNYGLANGALTYPKTRKDWTSPFDLVYIKDRKSSVWNKTITLRKHSILFRLTHKSMIMSKIFTICSLRLCHCMRTKTNFSQRWNKHMILVAHISLRLLH